ncbi:MAG: molybdate ABC transporter permease subunit [Maricaulis sp.]|nr:molybdate ABC transporter permease subunit [Maricaulis sp.]
MSATASAIFLTLNLAAVTTLILFALGTPLAWWLATTRSRWRPVIEAITALPLVLPPTVIGFYLLILLNPTAPIGQFWVRLTGDTLTFSFSGLVVASLLYSLPFMVQPLQTAFERIGRDQIEAAASLGAAPFDLFVSLVLPLSVRGFLTAGILTFIHTIGEFGVVLMVGGNIPGRTRTLSIALYDHVEALRYDEAHALAAGLVGLSLLVLSLVYWLNRRRSRHEG